MPASQVLIPQRQGEEVPPSQIMVNGPFSDELTKPKFVAPQVRETGFGGPGHAILAFANNFLQGASQGRLRQFQESEVTKREHERNFDSTVQHIMDSPNYTADFKEKIYQQALATKASAGIAALGKGKGGKNEHPMIGLARGVFNSIVGPSENKQHVDIGPEHISDLMSQMHAPENQFRLDEAVGQAGQKLKALGDTLAQESAAKKTPIYQEDLLNHQGYQEAVAPLIRQGINPAPFVQSMVSRFQPRPTPAQTLAEAKAQKELDQAKAQEEHWKKQNEILNRPVAWIWESGGKVQQGSVKFGPKGEMLDLEDKPIPAADPRKTAGRAVNPYDTMALRNEGAALTDNPTTWVDEKTKQVMRWDAAKKIAVPVTDASGKTVTGHTPAPPGFTPTQIQNREVDEIVGKLQMDHGDDLDAKLAAAKSLLSDKPGVFAAVDKKLRLVTPKKKKLGALGSYLSGKKTGATTTPPIVVAPAQTGAPVNPYR